MYFPLIIYAITGMDGMSELNVVQKNASAMKELVRMMLKKHRRTIAVVLAVLQIICPVMTASADTDRLPAENLLFEFLPEAGSGQETTPSVPENKTPENKECAACVDTQYFGTAEIRLISENAVSGNEIFTVSEITEEENGEETVFGLLGAMQKVRAPEGEILGSLLLQTELVFPEGIELNEAEYAVILAVPDRTAETDVYEITNGTAVHLESGMEMTDGIAEVVFSAKCSTVIALEFSAEKEEEQNFGFIDMEPEGDFSLEGIEEEPASDGSGNRTAGLKAYLPESYSSLENGELPEVRDQGSFGTCWSFGTLAAAEADMIRKGYADAEEIDYSEAALVYYMSHRPTDPMNLTEGDDFHRLNLDYRNGGNSNMATDLLSGWMGAVDEANAPYSWLADNEDDLAAGGTELAYQDEAIMTGAEYYSISDRNAVKQAIMNHGALAISYYSSSSSYITRGDRTYYYQNTSTGTNHCVAIVGWDDSVSRYMFSTRPSTDGAWLARNSWGSDWGSGGYFYISYAERELTNVIALSFAPSDTYDHNYFYDGAAGWGGVSLPAGQKAGNVFRVTGEEGESQSLKAVSFEIYDTGRDYSIDVYISTDRMEDPEDGDRITAAHLDGRSYTSGYYTVELPAAVELPAGTWFSVVFKNTGTRALKIGSDKTETGSWYQTTNHTASGESFTWNGSSWTDLDADNTGSGRTWRIKAFTKDEAEEETVELTLEPSELVLEKGASERLVPVCSPSDASASYRWTSSDASVATVDGRGVVTARKDGSCTIRCSYSESVYAEAEVTVSDRCTVIFETWAGSEVPRESVVPGSLLNPPDDPVLVGYSFDGWYRDSSLSQAWNFETDTVTSDITLYAKWTLAGSLTLTADAGNGILLDGTGWYQGTVTGLDDRILTTEVRFLDVSGGDVTVDAALIESWTASAGDNSIICYDTCTPTKRTLYIAFNSEDGRVRTGSSFRFGGIPVIRPAESITGLSLLAAGDSLNSLRGLFEGMGYLTTVDLSGLSTSGVTDMNSMFSGCTYLTGLDVSTFDTGSVTDMGSMFDSCRGLKTLNVSGFETELVTDFSRMFYGCSSLTVLDVSGFDTGSALNMNRMFYSCTGITELDVSGFETGSVTDMGRMFGGITKVTALDLDGFVTDFVTDMSGMFYCCYKLGSLDLSSFNTAVVTNMNMMFYKCSVLPELDLSNFSTENVTDMGRMFESSVLLESVDLSRFSTGASPVTSGMFKECNSLSLITIGSEFHPASAVLPGPTEARKSAVGPTIDGLWHRKEVPYTSYTPAEMCMAPAGTYTALPFTFFTAVFDADGGTEVPETQYLLPGEKVTEPEDEPIKTGHRFLGWYLGDSLYDFDTVPDSDITLNARWEIISYSVRFDSDGGVPEPGETQLDYGSYVEEPEGISRGLDVLEGWYTDEARTVKWDFGKDTVSSEITLYAKWTVRYSVQFHADGGIPEPREQIVASGKTVSEPDEPVKKGYTFLGWYQSDILYDFDLPVTGDLILTAHWKKTPLITVQPEGRYVKAGKTAVFSVRAAGEGLKYQWQYQTKNGKTWSDSGLPSADTPDLTVSVAAALNGMKYRCIVTDSYEEELYSVAAVLTVKPDIRITAQPAAQAAKSGRTVTFKVTATGDKLTYQWQSSKDGKKWTNISGTAAKKASYAVKVSKTNNGYQYRCVITDSDKDTLTSKAAKLTMKAELKITSQPTAQAAKSGRTVTFKVTATGDKLTYQWQYSKDGKKWTNISGSAAKKASYTVKVTKSNNGYQYRCVITDSDKDTLTSKAEKLTMKTELKITAQPKAQAAKSGKTVTFKVTATGDKLTYQWQSSKDGKKWTNISGSAAKKASYTVKVTKSNNGYRYRCVIIDSDKAKVTSKAVKLTLKK